jgi:type II secretory pathway pseudopilin PulG
MMKPSPIRHARPSEEGYVLLAVIFMLALFTIALSIATPRVIKQIQRDRELETMQRGKQYIRAIKLYYKKYGAYPPNLDALAKPSGPNNLRFLRKKYADPTTGKADWKPVLFGQNKAPTAMGFFGVPLTSSTIAGIGPGASGNGLTQPAATTDSSTQQTPDPNNPTPSGTDTTGATTGTTTGTTTGPTGQTFGGAGIIGFSPNSPKQSIMVYKTKSHYNEWEFVYDPISEQMMISGAGGTGLGQPASNSTTPIGGTSSLSGAGSGGSVSGAPTEPQQ